MVGWLWFPAVMLTLGARPGHQSRLTVLVPVLVWSGPSLATQKPEPQSLSLGFSRSAPGFGPPEHTIKSLVPTISLRQAIELIRDRSRHAYVSISNGITIGVIYRRCNCAL